MRVLPIIGYCYLIEHCVHWVSYVADTQCLHIQTKARLACVSSLPSVSIECRFEPGKRRTNSMQGVLPASSGVDAFAFGGRVSKTGQLLGAHMSVMTQTMLHDCSRSVNFVRDYTDFFASEHHMQNAGRILQGSGKEFKLPNWSACLTRPSTTRIYWWLTVSPRKMDA